MNTTKNIDYTEKCFKQKLSIIKFPAKNSVDAYLLSLPGVELGVSNNWLFFIYYSALKLEKNFYINPETLLSNPMVR